MTSVDSEPDLSQLVIGGRRMSSDDEEAPEGDDANITADDALSENPYANVPPPEAVRAASGKVRSLALPRMQRGTQRGISTATPPDGEVAPASDTPKPTSPRPDSNRRFPTATYNPVRSARASGQTSAKGTPPPPAPVSEPRPGRVSKRGHTVLGAPAAIPRATPSEAPKPSVTGSGDKPIRWPLTVNTGSYRPPLGRTDPDMAAAPLPEDRGADQASSPSPRPVRDTDELASLPSSDAAPSAAAPAGIADDGTRGEKTDPELRIPQHLIATANQAAAAAVKAAAAAKRAAKQATSPNLSTALRGDDVEAGDDLPVDDAFEAPTLRDQEFPSDLAAQIAAATADGDDGLAGLEQSLQSEGFLPEEGGSLRRDTLRDHVPQFPEMLRDARRAAQTHTEQGPFGAPAADDEAATAAQEDVAPVATDDLLIAAPEPGPFTSQPSRSVPLLAIVGLGCIAVLVWAVVAGPLSGGSDGPAGGTVGAESDAGGAADAGASNDAARVAVVSDAAAGADASVASPSEADEGASAIAASDAVSQEVATEEDVATAALAKDAAAPPLDEDVSGAADTAAAATDVSPRADEDTGPSVATADLPAAPPGTSRIEITYLDPRGGGLTPLRDALQKSGEYDAFARWLDGVVAFPGQTVRINFRRCLKPEMRDRGEEKGITLCYELFGFLERRFAAFIEDEAERNVAISGAMSYLLTFLVAGHLADRYDLDIHRKRNYDAVNRFAAWLMLTGQHSGQTAGKIYEDRLRKGVTAMARMAFESGHVLARQQFWASHSLRIKLLRDRLCYSYGARPSPDLVGRFMLAEDQVEACTGSFAALDNEFRPKLEGKLKH